MAVLIHTLLHGSEGRAEQLVEESTYKSRDGRKLLETRLWTESTWAAGRYDIVLKEGETVRYRRIIPPEKEARYVKVSWAPTSDAALVAVNYKAGEDWILIRLAKGKAVSDSFFDGDTLLMAQMFEELPFHDEIKNSAPVGRVPWNELKWLKHRRCTMPFIFRGIGYEGTANLLIDYRLAKPAFSVVSIVPGVDQSLWDQN